MLGKVTKLLVEKLCTSEVISERLHGRGGGGGEALPLGLNQKSKVTLTPNFGLMHPKPKNQ